MFLTVSKGISANMMKISSKRRRTRKEIQEQKEADAAKEADHQAKTALLAQAEAKLQDYDNMQANLEKAKAMMLELQAQGAVNIDDHGNVSPSKGKPRDNFLPQALSGVDFGQEGAFSGQ